MNQPVYDPRVVEEYRYKRAKGLSRDAMIADLHMSDYSIIHSIRIIRDVWDVSLGEAKQIVTAHPVWRPVARQMDALHEEMLAALRQDPSITVVEDGSHVSISIPLNDDQS